ncbi:GNAT family N-acetyltransferase [Flavobacterium aquicola]|uniref:L-amino acid N-acyltransferase YncA n=1 Tax=Flavobacterium aquicola TaxID=1682742 RepID=A0A3E0EK51_9FLAO|nr:GNAT family N-acetyltransferase [Flavobacterium aquicola]REG98624.1 L-amino acid N-acyltransferase YncA [Flavobacterium aquicola]
MNYSFRKATTSEIPAIWDILQQAIARRKRDGSEQWQDGYPNPEVVKKDVDAGHGFVLIEGENIIGYTAVLINDEPEYAKIIGEWLSNYDFVVFHRVAISENHLGKGLSKKILEFIEEFALSNNIYSVKADTNFDNIAMLKIFEKSGYKYCGKVYFRGGERRAFEKVLTKVN